MKFLRRFLDRFSGPLKPGLHPVFPVGDPVFVDTLATEGLLMAEVIWCLTPIRRVGGQGAGSAETLLSLKRSEAALACFQDHAATLELARETRDQQILSGLWRVRERQGAPGGILFELSAFDPIQIPLAKEWAARALKDLRRSGDPADPAWDHERRMAINGLHALWQHDRGLFWRAFTRVQEAAGTHRKGSRKEGGA